MATRHITTIRQDNILALLRALRREGPMARVELGQRIGVSSATVTSITAELMEHGLILEREADRPSSRPRRGRPRTMIDLDPAAAAVVCVKLSLNEIRLVVGDCKGLIQQSVVYTLDTHDFSPEGLIGFLVERIEALRAEVDHRYRRFAGIGVAVQGVAAAAEGEIVWSPAFAFRRARIAERLAEAFRCRVCLDNDTNCIGRAIMMQPEYRHCRDLAVLMLGYGVGMCLFVDGRPYVGATGSSGEFGHSKYQFDGALCACGRRGCIEAYVGDYALYREARAFLELPGGDPFHPDEAQMQALTELARAGDPVAASVFDNAARVLGVGLSNVLALFNPDAVVITGSGVRAYDLLEAPMKAALHECLVPELVGATRIDSHPWDRDLSCLGGIAAVLEAADPECMASG